MKLPRGRPTKVAPTPSSSKVSAGASNRKRKAVEPATQRKKRGPYKRWIDGANKVFLDAAVVAKLKGYDPDKRSADDLTALMQISGSTLRRAVKQEKNGTTNASSGKSTHLKKSALTTKEDCEWLANIAAFRDKNNNGMPRAEMISLISELSTAKNLKQAENHFDYLIRSK